jgi:hypothetical protein
MLARIRDASNNLYEFRSPVDGRIASPPIAKEGDQITANQIVARLIPDQATVVDALRALAFVGTKDDLSLIDDVTRIDTSAEITKQAAQTTKDIRARNGETGH